MSRTNICPLCNLFCEDMEIPFSAGSDREEPIRCSLVHSYVRENIWNDSSPRNLGESISWEKAYDLSNNLIDDSSLPLVVLTGDCSCEAQEEGISLARSLNSIVETPMSAFEFAIPLAAVDPGFQTTTLGDVIMEADKLLFWGCQPEKSMPLLMDRINHSFDHLIVNIQYQNDLKSPSDILLERGKTIPFLEELRGLLQGKNVSERAPELVKLKDFLMSATYGVLFLGEDLLDEGPHGLVEIYKLFSEIKSSGHWSILNIANTGNALGACEALSRASGFSHSVRFDEDDVQFVPQYGNVEELLLGGAVDLAVFIGKPQRLSDKCIQMLNKISSITIGSKIPDYKTLWLPAGKTGIHTPGSMVRFDGVVMEFSAVLPGKWLPAEEIIKKLMSHKVQL